MGREGWVDHSTASCKFFCIISSLLLRYKLIEENLNYSKQDLSWPPLSNALHAWLDNGEGWRLFENEHGVKLWVDALKQLSEVFCALKSRLSVCSVEPLACVSGFSWSSGGGGAWRRRSCPRGRELSDWPLFPEGTWRETGLPSPAL